MNLYFLVEGRRTERKVYPRWLSYLVPELTEVRSPDKAVKNSYYVFSGNGYPSILDNHLVNSVADVNALGNYDYLVMCIDADEASVHERRAEVEKYISDNAVELKGSTKFILIIQNRCIETWCLGNKRVYKNNPKSSTLIEYINFYNVKTNDPELIGNFDFETHAQFHEAYLSEMLLERNMRYTKKHPQAVTDEAYLNELILRANSSPHIETFKDFLDFCLVVRSNIE